MENINIEIPINTINQGETAVLEQVALQLYQKKLFTFGQVRRLLNLSVWELQQLLGKHNIERHYDEEDLATDIQSIQCF
ncbi:UPF0175 family protein [Spirulina sp. CS-785/01]|uniref:UPF0175 family protein n=1 Tax=Spirulina sp. CS-785/01 TaxID=3021716 RepID=UPI00232AD5E1|nr:UPF0175 family protein [Spirulina sp. CS-785/01]MDB9314373.1 UPF0175 family protein [Spirulina sp. CS-785/01]